MEHTLTTNDIIRISTQMYAAALTSLQFGNKEMAQSQQALAEQLAVIHDDAQKYEDVTIKVIREAPTAA